MLWQLFLKGGVAMYLLLAVSVWGLYLVIYKFLYLKLEHGKITHTLAKAKSHFSKHGKEETLDHLHTQKGLLNHLFYDALKSWDVKEVASHELLKLERNLNILSTIITAAPMIGLFGTVMGLIRIFGVVSGGTMGDPSLLAGGISEVLIATVAGLIIAIVFMFPYQLLAHRTDVFILDTQHALNDFLDFCHAKEGVK